MARGLEGGRLIHRGAETQMIHKESGQRTPESVIEAQRRFSSEIVAHSSLIAALHGEEAIPFIASNRDPRKQLSLAQTLLLNTPFIKKLMPEQYDDLDQGALIVSLAIDIQKQRQAMQ